LGRGATTLIPPRSVRANSESRAQRATSESKPAPEPAAAPTNVHQFPREPVPAPGSNPRMSADERAHFSTLLDELIELKSRLRSARRRTRIAP